MANQHEDFLLIVSPLSGIMGVFISNYSIFFTFCSILLPRVDVRESMAASWRRPCWCGVRELFILCSSFGAPYPCSAPHHTHTRASPYTHPICSTKPGYFVEPYPHILSYKTLTFCHTKTLTFCLTKPAHFVAPYLEHFASPIHHTRKFCLTKSACFAKLPSGVKLQNGIKLQSTVKMQNGIQLHNGVKLQNGTKLQSEIKWTRHVFWYIHGEMTDPT